MATPARHLIRVILHRKGEAEYIDGGTVRFTGRDYDTFDESAALVEILPGGTAPETLDLSLDGYIRWRGHLIPANDFERLEVQIVSKSR